MRYSFFLLCLLRVIVLNEVQPAEQSTLKNVKGNKNSTANPYAVYGEMQNAALTHLNNNFLTDAPVNFSSRNNAINYSANYVSDFLKQNYTFTSSEIQEIARATDAHKNFIDAFESVPNYLLNTLEAKEKVSEVY